MKDPNRLCLGCMNELEDMGKPCPICGFIESEYETPPRWLPIKHILNGKYLVGKVIGEGGFGITYIGWDLNLQVRVAIKEYFPVGLATRENSHGNYSVSALSGVRMKNYRVGLEKFMTEAKNLSKFYNLDGIVAVKDFFFENATAYMVMEYVDGITLGTYLKQHGGCVGEEVVLKLFRPVMESLKIMHQSEIIHRDISPDNIMMTNEGKMKLIDFGAARFAGGDEERSLTIILKHGYAPAEQYQSHGNQGPWTDVYAICATMYRMITGKVPPSAMDRFHEDTLEEFSALGYDVSEKTAYAIIDKGLAIKIEDRYKNIDELLYGLYGNEQKVVRKKKKTNAGKKYVTAAIAGVCVITIVVGGYIFNKNKKNVEDPVSVSSHQTVEEESTHENKIPELESSIMIETNNETDLPELKPISIEELETLQKQAAEDSKLISAEKYQIGALNENHQAICFGTNYYGNLDINKWEDLQAIVVGSDYTLGLKLDGTVLSAGNTNYGKAAVESWKNIAKIATGSNHTIGLKADGTVIAAGNNREGQCNVYDWTDIVDIAASESHSYGLKADGTVCVAGSENYMDEVMEWTDIAYIYANDYTCVGLKKDGTIKVVGTGWYWEELESWEQVISVVIGQDFIAGLLSNHTVVVAGEEEIVMRLSQTWTDVKAIAASDETIFAMKEDGTLVRTTYSYGSDTLENFIDLKSVSAAGGYIAGLKNDGTIVTFGLSGENFGQEEVKNWTGVESLTASTAGIMGLYQDGTIDVIGNERFYDAKNWTNISQISMADLLAFGVQKNGKVQVCGHENFIEEYQNLSNVSVMEAGSSRITGGIDKNGKLFTRMEGFEPEQSVIDIAGSENLIAAVLEDGTVEIGNYGEYVGAVNGYSWQDVVQIAVGSTHAIGLKKDGTVVAAGSNKNGQCDVSDWKDVVYIEADEYYTLGISADGTLLKAGKMPGEF